MIELDHFVNRDYAWFCKDCLADNETRARETGARNRFLVNEARDDSSSPPEMARWRDASHQILVCPRCQIEERVSKA